MCISQTLSLKRAINCHPLQQSQKWAQCLHWPCCWITLSRGGCEELGGPAGGLFLSPSCSPCWKAKQGAGLCSAASQIKKTPFSQVIRCHFITIHFFFKGWGLDLHQIPSLLIKHHLHFSLIAGGPKKLPNSWRRRVQRHQELGSSVFKITYLTCCSQSPALR